MNSSGPEREGKPRIIVVGGFLGAGKTSAIARLGSFLKQTALTVGVISTASGAASVDTIRLRHSGLKVEEVSGSYLRASAVAEAARRLGTSEVIIEAPGSSVNLRPLLESLASLGFDVAPLTIVVDAQRAPKLLRLDGPGRFSENVAYLYRKQLEEASLIIVNHGTAKKPSVLHNALERHFSEAATLALGKDDAGVAVWAQCLSGGDKARAAVEVDPVRYAQASAALAALNSTVNLSSVRYFDANKVLLDLATVIQALLQQEAIEIAHLKLAFASRESDEISSVHATGNDTPPELQHSQSEPAQRGQMVLNLRAEGDPELLHSAVNRAILAIVEKTSDLFARMEDSVHFRPEAPPVQEFEAA